MKSFNHIIKRLDENYIIHSKGCIIDLNNLNLLYSKENDNILFNNKSINMSEFIIKEFYNINLSKENILYLDNNQYHNDIENLNVNLNIENSNYKINTKIDKIINDNNEYVYYLPIIYQYCYYTQKLIRCHSCINKTYFIFINNDIIKKKFILSLFTNKYTIYPNLENQKKYYWTLELKKIILSKKTLNESILNFKYTLLFNNYFISNDSSHIIYFNYSKINLLKIYLNNSGYYYVRLYNGKITTKYLLNFYNNPNYYNCNNDLYDIPLEIITEGLNDGLDENINSDLFVHVVNEFII